MKAFRNFMLKWLFIFTAIIGMSVWFIQSQWLSNYGFIQSGKDSVKSLVSNFYEEKKNSSIEWVLNKVGYSNQESVAQDESEKDEGYQVVSVTPKNKDVGEKTVNHERESEVIKPVEPKEKVKVFKIPFYYDHTNAPSYLSKEKALEIINKASNEWENACGVGFEFKSERQAEYVDVNRTIPGAVGLIHWGDLDDDAIGLAHQGSPRGYAKGFVLTMSRDYFDDVRTKSHVFNVMLHEMGHVIGLGHNQISDSVMYGKSHAVTVQKMSKNDASMCNYLHARWRGMSDKEAQEKYQVIVSNNNEN